MFFAVVLPIAILAGCLVAIRVVRQQQRRRALGNAGPVTSGDVEAAGHDPADEAVAEHRAERVDDERPVSP